MLQVITIAIDRACELRKWSMAQLAREIGMTDESLGKWRAGKTARMDVPKLVALFRLAEMSMDEAFALSLNPNVRVGRTGKVTYTPKEVDLALRIVGWATVTGMIEPGERTGNTDPGGDSDSNLTHLQRLSVEPSSAEVVAEMTQHVLKKLMKQEDPPLRRESKDSGYGRK